MKFGELYSIGKRLYQNYINKFILRILIALFLSVLVAGSTSAIAGYSILQLLKKYL